MRPAVIATIVPIFAGVLGVFLLGYWLGSGRQPLALSERIPVAERATPPGQLAPVNLSGTFVISDGVVTPLPGVWPGFRGEREDGVCTETVPLARGWSAEGPSKLWAVDCGEGYAGAAVRAGRVYLLDYDQQERRDVLRCLSLADGKDIWRRSYPVKVKRNHGMSRTVTAVSEKYAVSLGPKCHVLCVDAVTGAYRWGLDLVRQFRGKVPAWYAGQCPLIDGDRVILAPGGDALLIAVDAATGKILWRTPNPDRLPMSHSSIIPMTVFNQRTYVYCAQGGVVGVSADDGRVLWQTDEWKVRIATIPTPLILPGGRIFLAGGYNAGSLMLQLKREEGKITVKTLYRLKPDEFGSDQQTPIYYQDYIYGVIPGGQLVCLRPDGKLVWNSGTTRFGLGPYLIADGMLYLLNDTGILTLVEASPAGYHQLAQAKVLSGPDAWGPPALAGGRLLVRDLTHLVCLDVRRR